MDTATALWVLLPLAIIHAVLARRRTALAFQIIVDVVLLATPLRLLARGEHLGPGVSWASAWGAPTTMSGSIEQGDLPLQFAVWWEEVRRLGSAGEPPWISDRLGGGTPLLAHGQSGVPFPLQMPVWALGAERGTDVMAIWKLELAALGGFMMLRRLGLRAAACGTGAVAYAFGPFMLSWLVVPLGWVAAAAPWALYLLLGALRGRRRESALLALLLGALAGWSVHPESAAFLMLAVTIAAVVLGWGRRRRLLRILPSLLLACAVASVGALPTLFAIGDSAKLAGARAAPLYPSPEVSGAVRLRSLALLLVPWREGHPADGSWRWPFAAAAVSVGAGAVTLALLAAAAPRRRHRRFALALAVVGGSAVVLLYQMPPFTAVLARLPVLRWMIWARAGFLIPLTLAAGAALATDAWLRRQRRARLVASAAAVQAAVCVLVATAPPTSPPRRLWTEAWAPAVLAGLTPIVAATSGWILPGLVAGEAVLVGAGLVPASVRPTTEPPLVVALQHRAAASPGRIVGSGGALPANLAARFGLRDLRSYEPMRSRSLAALHRALGSDGLDLPGPVTRPWAGLAGAWGVRWLATPASGLSAGPWVAGWREVLRSRDGRIYLNPDALPVTRLASAAVAPPGDPRDGGWQDVDFATTAVVVDPPALGGQGALEIVEERPWRILARVMADGEVLLVHHAPRTVGWRASVDGRGVAIVTANVAAMAVVVPAGNHLVRIEYAPAGLPAGATITLLGLVGCAALVWRRRQR